ncbi:MAG: Haloalkane dehalogenase-like protein, partial [uncultured Frankineae bacterium]
ELGAPRVPLRLLLDRRRRSPDGVRRRGLRPARGARARQPDLVVLLARAAARPAAAGAAGDRPGPHRHGAVGEAVGRRLPPHPGPAGRRLRRVRRRARPGRAPVAGRARLGRRHRAGLGRGERRAGRQAAGPQHGGVPDPGGQGPAVAAHRRPAARRRRRRRAPAERLQPGRPRHGHRAALARPGGAYGAGGPVRQPGAPRVGRAVRQGHPALAARPGVRRARPHRVAAAPARGPAHRGLLGHAGPGLRRRDPGAPAHAAAAGRGPPLGRRRPLRPGGRPRADRARRHPTARAGV